MPPCQTRQRFLIADASYETRNARATGEFNFGRLRPSTVGMATRQSRAARLTHGITPQSQHGIEIGALNHPTIPPEFGKVPFVDYTFTSELQEQHRTYPDRVRDMVDVTYVWSGSGSLTDIIGAEAYFDWAIASHVIEHVPNVLGWFRGIATALKPGAKFNLAIPDKRFTFDFRRNTSTLGELTEADLLSYTKPSIRQQFDHTYNAAALLHPADTWVKDFKADAVPRLCGDVALQLAYDQSVKIAKEGDYLDSHCWTFTPLTFAKLFDGATELGLFPFLVDDIIPTIAGEFEFFVYLSLADPNSALDFRRHQLLQTNNMVTKMENHQRWLASLGAD